MDCREPHSNKIFTIIKDFITDLQVRFFQFVSLLLTPFNTVQYLAFSGDDDSARWFLSAVASEPNLKA